MNKKTTYQALEKRIEELEKANKLNTELLEESIDNIWKMDLRLRFTYISPSIYSNMGYTPEEWIGSKLSSHATFPEFIKMAKKALGVVKRWREGADIEVFEAKMLHKNGTPIEVEIAGKVLFNIHGLPIGLIGSTRVITERKEAERKLKEKTLELEENQLISQIINSTSEGIFGVDTKGNITFINTAVEKLLGYTIDELKGRNSHDVFHHHHINGKEYHACECPMRTAFLTGDESHGDDEIFWKKDGSMIEVEFSSMPVYKNNKLNGAVISFKDIGERKKAEQEIKSAKENIQLVLDTVPIGIAIVDPKKRRALMANNNMLQMLEITDLAAFDTSNVFTNENTRLNLLNEFDTKGEVLNQEVTLLRHKSKKQFGAYIGKNGQSDHPRPE